MFITSGKTEKIARVKFHAQVLLLEQFWYDLEKQFPLSVHKLFHLQIV